MIRAISPRIYLWGLCNVLVALAMLPFGTIGCIGSSGTFPVDVAYIDQEDRLVVARFGKPKIEIAQKVISFDWAPNGDSLAYIAAGPQDHPFIGIWLGKEKRTMILGNPLDDPDLIEVSWSPDGKYLTLDYGRSCVGRLAVVDPSLGAVVAQVGYSMRYVWSPTGEYIAYSHPVPLNPPLPTETGGSHGVTLLDIATSKSVLLVEGDRRNYYIPSHWLNSDELAILGGEPLSRTTKFYLLCSRVTGIRRAEDIEDPYASLLSKVPDDYRTELSGAPSLSSDQRFIAFKTKHPDSKIVVYDITRGAATRLGRGKSPPKIRPTVK